MRSFLLALTKYIVMVAIFVLLLVLNYFVWNKGHHQEKEIKLLQKELNMQTMKNKEIEDKNQQLKEMIHNLKVGSHEMIEEEARKDFGMVGKGETYFNVDDEPLPESDKKDKSSKP